MSMMVYMYSRVVVRLWFKTIESSEASKKAALRHRKRVTITVIIVSVIYAICWIPDVTDYVIASQGQGWPNLVVRKGNLCTTHIQRLCKSSVIQHTDEEIS